MGEVGQRRAVLCVGAAHWDMIARAQHALTLGSDVPGRLVRRPGGVALNVALGIARQGGAARLCAILGRDAPGNELCSLIAGSGIDTRYLCQMTHAVTDAYLAIESPDGDLFGAVADGTTIEAHADRLCGRATQAMKDIGTVMLDANLPFRCLETLAQEAAKRHLEIVVNPVSPAKAPRLAGLFTSVHDQSMHSHCTIVANLAEANAIVDDNCEYAAPAARALVAMGAVCALVTNGSRAVALATSATCIEVTPPQASAAIPATGLGDALMAAYLTFPDRRGRPEEALRIAVEAPFNLVRGSN